MAVCQCTLADLIQEKWKVAVLVCAIIVRTSLNVSALQ